METIKKVGSGIKMAVIVYVGFVFVALLYIYLSGSGTVKAGLPTALRFAIYGGLLGAVLGYIEDDEEKRTKNGKLENGAHGQKLSVVASILKIVESIFANLKLIIFLAVIAAGVYAYYKYLR